MDLNGHVPIELSQVLAGFLAASETHSLTAKVFFVENENVKWVLSFVDITELGQNERKRVFNKDRRPAKLAGYYTPTCRLL